MVSPPTHTDSSNVGEETSQYAPKGYNNSKNIAELKEATAANLMTQRLNNKTPPNGWGNPHRNNNIQNNMSHQQQQQSLESHQREQLHAQQNIHRQFQRAQEHHESQQQLQQYQQQQQQQHHLRFSNEQLQHQLHQRQHFQHRDARLSQLNPSYMHARERTHQQVMSLTRSVLPSWGITAAQVAQAQAQAQARAQSQANVMQHQHGQHPENPNIGLSNGTLRDWNEGSTMQSASQIQNMKLAMAAIQQANQRRSLMNSNNPHQQQHHLNRLALASTMMNNSGLTESERAAVMQQNQNSINSNISARIAAARQRGMELMSSDPDTGMGLLARMAADSNRPGSQDSSQR